MYYVKPGAPRWRTYVSVISPSWCLVKVVHSSIIACVAQAPVVLDFTGKCLHSDDYHETETPAAASETNCNVSLTIESLDVASVAHGVQHDSRRRIVPRGNSSVFAILQTYQYRHSHLHNHNFQVAACPDGIPGVSRHSLGGITATHDGCPEPPSE